MVLCVTCFGFCTGFTYIIYEFKLGSGGCVSTFWERAAHSVNRMFSIVFPVLVLRVQLSSSWSLLAFYFLCLYKNMYPMCLSALGAIYTYY